MTEPVDHFEELEERIRENCVTRWSPAVEHYNIPDLDRAYAELLIAQMAYEAQNEI